MALPLPVAVFDGPAHVLTLVNRAWERAFGDGAHVGRPLRDASAELAAAAPFTRLDEVYRTGMPIHVADASLPIKGALRGSFAVTATPLRDPTGAPCGIVAACMPGAGVAAAEMEAASQLKDRFLAVLSHELRAPLATVLLWERILRADPENAALRARALDAIRDSATAQATMVEELLDVSRALSGKLAVDLKPIAIEDLLRATLDSTRPLAAARSLSLDAELASPLGIVEADARRLRQVLDNLLSNAMKFTAAGGRIMLRARRTAGQVEIEVEDTGRGIALEVLPRIFDVFCQGEEASTRTHGGLGLGLAISHELVALHGGELRAASAGVGHGSTFSLTLRGCDALTTHRSDRELNALPSPLVGVRVLIVDDEPLAREALGLLLTNAGATVQSVHSTANAWLVCREAPPDVLVSDLAMPGEDGYALIERVRSHERGPRRMPALAVSAMAQRTEVARALACGFDAHFAKPIDVDRLIATIKRLLVRDMNNT